MFQHQLHVPLAIVDKQDQVHVSISILTRTTVETMVLSAIQLVIQAARGVCVVVLPPYYFLELFHHRDGVVQPQWMMDF